MWFVVLAVIALTAVACMPAGGPGPLYPRIDFVTDDPELAQATIDAANEWAKVGVAAASIVTVNQDIKDAMRIERRPREKLAGTCVMPGYAGDGCTSVNPDYQWDTIYVREDLHDPDRLRVVMMHELGHIISRDKGHVPDADGTAIMSGGNHPAIPLPTKADVKWLSERTEVFESEDVLS